MTSSSALIQRIAWQGIEKNLTCHNGCVACIVHTCVHTQKMEAAEKRRWESIRMISPRLVCWNFRLDGRPIRAGKILSQQHWWTAHHPIHHKLHKGIGLAYSLMQNLTKSGLPAALLICSWGRANCRYPAGAGNKATQPSTWAAKCHSNSHSLWRFSHPAVRCIWWANQVHSPYSAVTTVSGRGPLLVCNTLHQQIVCRLFRNYMSKK